jgi:class 3 adenylate cyclase
MANESGISGIGVNASGRGAAEARVRELIDSGQFFLAYDVAMQALAASPDDRLLRRLAAQALIQIGGTDEARKLLEPLCRGMDLHDPHLIALYRKFHGLVASLRTQEPGTEPAVAAFADLVQAIGGSRDLFLAGGDTDEETLGHLARAYKDIWKRSRSDADARRCRDMYERAFTLTGGYWTGINAATLSWILGQSRHLAGDLAGRDQEWTRCAALAGAVLGSARQHLKTAVGRDRVWPLATCGEAALLLGDVKQAVESYESAAAIARDFRFTVTTRQQLNLLADAGFDVPPRLFDVLKPPAVVVFTGHMIDAPGRPEPRFPPSLEGAVREALADGLAKIKARIGYSAAACGSDLLFVESMFDRGGEVNLVLPFNRDDFVETSVRHGGEQWVRRFDRAIKIVGDVFTRYATTEKYLGCTELFYYGQTLLFGLAELRARWLDTRPWLVAVHDPSSEALRGGTTDNINRWPDKERLLVIKLDELRRQAAKAVFPVGGAGAAHGAGATVTIPPPPGRSALAAAPAAEGDGSIPRSAEGAAVAVATVPVASARTIRCLLFADIVGFSRLQEQQVPYYMFQFLTEVSRQLGTLAGQPIAVNTWGDAIFAVMDEAIPLVRYAQALRRVVCETNWRELGLDVDMTIRVALHAGPVYDAVDPVTQRRNFFGSHVNRAARLEPVALPGHLYASEQFVSLLSAEQRGRPERPDDWPFACEYVGVLALAKDAGKMPVYRIADKAKPAGG